MKNDIWLSENRCISDHNVSEGPREGTEMDENRWFLPTQKADCHWTNDESDGSQNRDRG